MGEKKRTPIQGVIEESSVKQWAVVGINEMTWVYIWLKTRLVNEWEQNQPIYIVTTEDRTYKYILLDRYSLGMQSLHASRFNGTLKLQCS